LYQSGQFKKNIHNFLTFLKLALLFYKN